MLDRSALPSANLGVPCGALLDLPRAVRPNLGRRWPEAGKCYCSVVKERQPAFRVKFSPRSMTGG